jgi:hypothetical protein
MRISLAYCDLCKMKVDTNKMTKLRLIVPDTNSTKNDEYDGEVCHSCSSDIIKKLTTAPEIKVSAKPEVNYRTITKPGEPPETPYMGAFGNH